MPDIPQPRIYLDNAATSWPKPAPVYVAMDDYNRHLGVAVGRGAYQQSFQMQGIADRCRKRAADLLGAESRDQIVFTFNGTDSLNLALHGLLKPGDHVVTSDMEHNSVLRPLRELQRDRGVESSYVSANSSGLVDPVDVRAAIRPTTRLVAMIHASNVSGTIQPIADIAEISRNANALCLVDAAQSVGHVAIDLKDLPVDMLACPGHKGLLGPLGTGLLYLRPGVEEQLQSIRQGGTGSNSEDDNQPDTLPDKYESGNHNAPGICGLDASLDWLQERGIDSIHAHERELTGRLLAGLAGVDPIQIHGPGDSAAQVGVVSLTLPGFEPQVLASILDESFGIQSRAGLHCAPGAHRALGTFDTGGTVRLSVGPFSTADEIDTAIAGLSDVAAAL